MFPILPSIAVVSLIGGPAPSGSFGVGDVMSPPGVIGILDTVVFNAISFT